MHGGNGGVLIKQYSINPDDELRCPICGGEILVTHFISGSETMPLTHVAFVDEEIIFSQDWDKAASDYEQRELDGVECRDCRSAFSFPYAFSDELDGNSPGLLWLAKCKHDGDCFQQKHFIELAQKMANGQAKEI